jgi:hypothetical protein
MAIASSTKPFASHNDELVSIRPSSLSITLSRALYTSKAARLYNLQGLYCHTQIGRTLVVVVVVYRVEAAEKIAPIPIDIRL